MWWQINHQEWTRSVLDHHHLPAITLPCPSRPSPIVLTFDYEKGTVLHMTSHYYLQRTELRSDRHKKSAKEYTVEEMGLSDADIKGDTDFDDLSLAEAESAYTSQQFIVNTMVERKKQVSKKMEGEGENPEELEDTSKEG